MATELSISIVATAAIGGAMRAFTQLGGGVQSLRSATRIATDEHRRLGGQIDRAMTTGVGNVGRLINQYYRLGDSIRAVNRNVNLRTNIHTNIENRQQVRGELMGQAMDLVGIGATVVTPVKLAIDFESAMADVRKVVEFDSPAQFRQMEQDILKLTHTIPLAGTELATIAASGGQLGVARTDLMDFTQTIAKMSVAFDMSAETAGESMAKLANAYEIPIMQIGKLGDAINHLSNSSPAKASNIVDTLGRVTSATKSFGLSELQATSLANAFISLGKSPDVAGTAINGMLSTLVTADKQGKTFQNALKKIGISAKELKKDISENGEQALLNFLKRVRALPEIEQTGILIDLFGKEYADDVGTLVSGVGQYEKAIQSLQATAKNGMPEFMGSMEKEFASRSATTANAIKTLKNQLTNLGINIGSVVLPTITGLIDKITPIVTKMIEWSSAHPTLIKGILTTIGALFAFRASTIAVKLLLNSFALTFLGASSQVLGFVGVIQKARLAVNLFSMGRVIAGLRVFGLSSRQALTVVRGFQKGLAFFGSAFSRLGSLGRVFTVLRLGAVGLIKALLTTPIGWIAMGIATAVFVIYKYWTPISSFFLGLWDGIKSGFAPLLATFSGIGTQLSATFAPVVAVLGGLWASIAPLVAPIIDWFGQFFAQSQMSGDGARSMGQTVGAVIIGIVNIVVGVASTIIGVWSGALSTLFSVAGSIWNGIRSLFTVAVAGLRAVIAGFSPVSAFSTAFSAVWGFLSGLVGRFRTFGVNIIQGLIGGIKSMAGAVVGAISSTVGNVAGTAKRMLGINSPSRVFRQFGSWVSEGLAIGIDKGGQKPVSAIGQVASGVTANFGAEMSNLSAHISTSIGEHQARMTNTNTTNSQSQGNITIHFNPTINAGGNDMGKIERALQISQAEFEKMFARMQADKLRRAY